MEPAFQICNLAILPFWLLMIVAPLWTVTQRIMASLVPVAVLAVVYLVLIVPRLPAVFPVVVHPELASVQALLGSPAGAVIGWIHYLAFDLFVGRWMFLDSRARGLNPWLMAPVLLLTSLLGPVGFLSYLGVRATRHAPATA